MPDTENDSRVEPEMEEEPLVVAGGNLFAALGLPNAEERHAKTKLAIRIGNILKERKLTQAEAAKLLNIAQSDMSNIVNGRTGGFTLERLLNIVNKLGYDIEIVVSSKPKASHVGHTLVTFIK